MLWNITGHSVLSNWTSMLLCHAREEMLKLRNILLINLTPRLTVNDDRPNNQSNQVIMKRLHEAMVAMKS